MIVSFFYAATATTLEDNNGGIKGKIVTSDGKPAADVSVILQGTSFMTVSDGAGTFVFKNVPGGNYQVAVSFTGFANKTEDVVVEAGKIAIVKFQLEVSSKQLSEIVITGNQTKLVRRSSNYVAKLPLANVENPTVYAVITKDLLAQQQVYTVDDAMRNAPGVTKMWDATNRSGDGGAYYNSRGFIVQSQFRNGVAGNVSSVIDASNLESIEVIKGPNATLFGNQMTSYGGLINRVTKKPYDHFGGEIAVAGGSFSYNRIMADVNTPLDSAKNILLRLNTAYTSQGSWMDKGNNKNFAFAPSLSYKVNDRLNFLVEGEFFSGEGNGNTFYFFPWWLTTGDLSAQRADKLNIDYNRTFANSDLTSTSRNANFFGTMNYKISDEWSSQSVISMTNSYSNGFGPYFYILAHDSISREDQSTENSRQSTVEIQQNFRGDFKIGKFRNRFVGGLDFFFLNSNQMFVSAAYDQQASHGNVPNYNDFNAANMTAVYQSLGKTARYPYIYKRYDYSAYASDVFNITDKLMVQAGLRIDYYDNKGNYSDTAGTTSGGYTQLALSPKFGIVYQVIQDRLSLFGNYQNGFTNTNSRIYPGTASKPEQANQLEGGAKMDMFDGKLTGTVSYYYIKVKDVLRADAEHTNYYLQNGSQESKGVEVNVVAAPFQGFSVVAGYSYNESKYINVSDDVNGLRPATASSPTSANLWLNYRISNGKLKGLSIGAGGNYASDVKVVNSRITGVFVLPAYTVLNTAISYETSKFRFAAKVDNLTDKHYWTGYSSMNPQKTRSFTGTVAFKF
jgi:iron complex outermembrane receptor protein